MRNCSTRYSSTNFVHSLPFISDQKTRGVIDQKALDDLVSQLKTVRNLDDFDAVIKRNWFSNPALMPLAEMELMDDILTAKLCPETYRQG